MAEPPPGRDVLRKALVLSAAQQSRADRAAEIAAQHEAAAETATAQLQPIHLRLAALHRKVERRHRAAAAVHGSFAERVERWSDTAAGSGPEAAAPPRIGLSPLFMAAVAETAEAQGAAVTLFGRGHEEVLSAASDPRVKSVQDVEFVYGEGPAHSCSRLRRAVTASGAELAGQWPVFGPAAVDLGVRRLAAVPIEIAHRAVGALTVYEPSLRHGETDLDLLRAIAETLHGVVLSDGWGPKGREPRLEPDDSREAVHQATGVVAMQRDCSPEDALAVVKARAFAADLSIDRVAAEVIAHRLWLAD